MVTRTTTPIPAAPMNRQESHRIYLQVFSPRSASQPKAGASDAVAAPILHRHESHEIHPPNYPTTTPGAPYQFNSSSESSQSSYSFSSLSTTPGGHRSSSHTVKNRFTGYPSTVTSSAAVRLTDRAKAKDVTALLRGKFGLPPISSKKKVSSSSSHHKPESSLPSYYSAQSDRAKMPTRLSQIQKDDNKRRYSYGSGGISNTNNEVESSRDDEEEVDALLLIGTLEGPPKGYLRFEHEEFIEEQQRLEVFQHYRYQQQEQEVVGQLESMSRLPQVKEHSEDSGLRVNQQQSGIRIPSDMPHLPVSESTATVKASGAQPGWASSMLLAPSASSEGAAMTISESEANLSTSVSRAMISSSGAIGLDLSSSRNNFARAGGAGNRTTSWGSLRGIGAGGNAKEMDFSSSRGHGKLSTLVSELSVTPSVASPRAQSALPSSQTQPKSPSPCYEPDLEPIHIVRTVLPDEHPLHVRDELMSLLKKLRQEAEEEMGLHLEEGGFQRKSIQPTFRWYFQPCSPLGGVGSSAQSPKIQSIPAYVDIEGYCTEEESESDNEDHDDTERDNSTVGKKQSNSVESLRIRQLIEEKQRIAMLQDLADPSFLVSGYLMKQSSRDPNVWRREYCVLSEDRMWTIGRMKPLKKYDDTDDILSSLRVGRHKYIKLHRSLLLERGDEGVQSKQVSASRYSGCYLTPLGHRLPHSFRMLTSEGKCHTFRAFNSQSFRTWVTSLSEKIAQKHGDGMMDLANVIAEEETLARSRRMDDIAVSPLETLTGVPDSKSPIPMDIVRFGIAVAAFRELCRHVNDAIRQYQYRNQSNVVNVQTRVGGGHTRARQPPSLTASQRAKNMEHAGMILSVWEDARMVASKSAQLLHALATLQHDKLSNEENHVSKEKSLASSGKNIMIEKFVEEQKTVQALLGKHWDQQNNTDDTFSSHGSLPPIHLFDPLLEKLQCSRI